MGSEVATGSSRTARRGAGLRTKARYIARPTKTAPPKRLPSVTGIWFQNHHWRSETLAVERQKRKILMGWIVVAFRSRGFWNRGKSRHLVRLARVLSMARIYSFHRGTRRFQLRPKIKIPISRAKNRARNGAHGTCHLEESLLMAAEQQVPRAIRPRSE